MTHKKKQRPAVLFFLIISFFNGLMAQDSPVLRDSLYSAILEEERPIEIILPLGYDKMSDFEMIYVLDGFSHFMSTEWSFLQGEGFIPKNTIMVGVNNTYKNGIDMRNRDFTPTATDAISGGADKFISFFKDELMPYINRKYHGKPKGHTLYGGSLGGLFAIYVLLKKPDLFTSYIAIDPALWWDGYLLHKQASALFKTAGNFHNTVYIAGRKGRPYHFMGVAGIDSILQTNSPEGIEWSVMQFSNDTHYSTNFKGFYEGLKFSYGGFYSSTGGYPASRNVIIKPHYGDIIKGKPFKLICFNLVPDLYIHYSTDGNEPTRASPKLEGEETSLVLDRDSKVIVKSFGMRDEYNKSDTAYFRTSASIPSPVVPSASVVAGGLRYRYYEADSAKLRDFKKLKPLKTGFTDKSFDINSFPADKYYACVLEGYIEISQENNYIFEMGDGNEFTKLWLGDQRILGNHYKTESGEGYLLALQKGFYPIRIEYFHQKAHGYTEWIYLKPEGIDDFPLPSSMLYTEPKN